MKLQIIVPVLITSLMFAGCSLLPGQNEQGDQSESMDDSAAGGTMLREDAMRLEAEGGLDQENMVGGDAYVGDGAMEADLPVAAGTHLVAEDFTYGVEEIRVQQGEPVTLTVTNKQGVHDFNIDELGVSTGLIPEGDTITIEIPTDEPGTYEFYCSVQRHREFGMKGMLIIE